MRRLILVLLLAGYAAIFVRLPSAGGRGRFDPLDPRGRRVEQAIASGRFDEARPIVEELSAAHPDEVVVAQWRAEVYGGLGRFADAALAWEAALRLAGEPDEICPALPLAYQRAGDGARALDAFRRCADAAPDDVERLVDLADAYTAAGEADEAAAALKRAAVVDPTHPRVRALADAGDSGGGAP